MREPKKGRGKPKITLVEVVKKYMSIKEVIESMTLDRIECRKSIHVADLDLYVDVQDP